MIAGYPPEVPCESRASRSRLRAFARPHILLPEGGGADHRQAREIRDKDHANEIKAKLEGALLEIKVKVGSTGRLFGSVTEKDVAQVIKLETGIDIDRHKIKLIKHVKNLGKHTAKVSLITGVSANVTVNVVE